MPHTPSLSGRPAARWLSFVVLAASLTACTQTSTAPTGAASASSASSSSSSSSAQLLSAASSASVASGAASLSSAGEKWESYHDDHLGIRIEYPATYRAEVTPAEDLQFGGAAIRVEAGVRFGDGQPEGNSVRVYRTADARILDYLKQDKPLEQSIRPDGTAYMRFNFIGLTDVFGYVTKRGAWYYVFESTWGPTNPVSERMLGSLTFDAAAR